MRPFIGFSLTAVIIMGINTVIPARAQAARYLWEAGDWLIRARSIVIDPDSNSDPINAPALGGEVPGSRVSVNESVTGELDFTYMLTRNFGLELILATSRHEVEAAGSARDLGDVLDTWVLPPTLTLQYHFLPGSRFQPYVGA